MTFSHRLISSFACAAIIAASGCSGTLPSSWSSPSTAALRASAQDDNACANAAAHATSKPVACRAERSEQSERSRSVHRNSSGSPITHIVLMIQENRSFDDFFATYPGANGTTTGQTHSGKTVPLKEQTLAGLDLNHLRKDYLQDCDLQPSGVCKMDGFSQAHIGPNPAHLYAYQYVDPSQIAPYWSIAQQYVLADNTFQTQGSGSFTAHQDLIAGATVIDPTDSVIDTPSNAFFWGCDAPKATVTSLLTVYGQYLQWQGPFPCFSYTTLRDSLDAAGVSWRYYSPVHKGGKAGALWNAFDAIDAVRNGPEWKTNISSPETNIFGDIQYGNLASMSWVIPSQQDSDHPHKLNGIYTGPQWIASVVNAIGNSQYWNNTAIVIVWDDWGGFYDHVQPPLFDNAGGLGFRVPMLIVSPYVAKGHVDHTQYEFGSILKFVEQTFSLKPLGTTDVRATSIRQAFHLNWPPRTFVPIPSSLNKRYFLHRKPDDEPVDSE